MVKPILIEVTKNIWIRYHYTWWRHQMETFSALLAICAGNSPVTGESPAQMPVTRSLDVFFNLRLNKQLSKQSWGWWLAALSRPIWRCCNEMNNHRPSAGRVLAAQIRRVLQSFSGYHNCFLPYAVEMMPLQMAAEISRNVAELAVLIQIAEFRPLVTWYCMSIQQESC